MNTEKNEGINEESSRQSLSEWLRDLTQKLREVSHPYVLGMVKDYEDSEKLFGSAKTDTSKAIVQLYRWMTHKEIIESGTILALLDIMTLLADEITPAKTSAEQAKKLVEDHHEIIERIKDFYREQIASRNRILSYVE